MPRFSDLYTRIYPHGLPPHGTGEGVLDLRNQIAFAPDGNYTALVDHGISGIDGTTRFTQNQFNRQLDMKDRSDIVE